MKKVREILTALLTIVVLVACQNQNEKMIQNLADQVNAELENVSAYGIESASCRYEGNDVVMSFNVDMPEDAFGLLQSKSSEDLSEMLIASMRQSLAVTDVDTEPVFKAMVEEDCNLVIKMNNSDGQTIEIEVSPKEMIEE